MIEYIKESDLKSSFELARQHMAPNDKPFTEFERIARNRPHPGIADGLPKVTDGTLSTLIRKQGRRTIQQLPTGKVSVPGDEAMGIIGGWVLEKEILAKSNWIAEAIQKCWAIMEKGGTYGSQSAFAQFRATHDGFTTDFSLPYIKDHYIEPGKLSEKDSNVQWLVSYYQKSDIDTIIAQCKARKSKAEKDKETYEDNWDLEGLEKMKDAIEEKDAESRTPNDVDKGGRTEAIQLVTCFQKGVGATFYTFNPKTGIVVRRKKNKDPRGVIPIHTFYYDFDFSNPRGRGAVEMTGGLQNLLDSEVQSYQYQRLYGMRPTKIIKGNVPRSAVKDKPGGSIFLTDPNSSIEYLNVSTTAIERFPDNYGLIKSQILNQQNTAGDTSISSEVGNPGFGKTPAALKQQQAVMGVDDNYMRKQFESFWQELAETLLNLYFAEREDVMELQLDKTTANKLRKVAPEMVNEENKVRIDFSGENKPLIFTVDPTTSAKEDQSAQVEVLSGLLERIEKSPMLSQLVPQDKVIEVWNSIVTSSGVENPEKLTIDTEGENGQPGEQAQAPQMTPEQVQAMIEEALTSSAPTDDPLLKVFKDLPESAKKQILAKYGIEAEDASPIKEELNIKKFDAAQRAAGPSDVEMDAQLPPISDEQLPDTEAEPIDTTEDDIVAAQELRQRGFTDEQVLHALELTKQEVPIEEILSAIGAPGAV